MTVINIQTIPDQVPEDYYVYVHYRVSDGTPFYVGKGVGKRYKSPHGRNTMWARTARKYGCKAVIYEDKLQEWAAFEIERDLIALYGRRNDNSGPLCNLTEGGDGVVGYKPTAASNKSRSEKLKGRIISPEHRAKITAANTGRVMSDITKKKISDKRVGRYAGENHPLFGLKKSEESIEKTAKHTRKGVVCIETGEVFKSVSDAAASIGGSTSAISKVCKGTKPQYKGFTWKYLKPFETMCHLNPK